jgi:malate synthase
MQEELQRIKNAIGDTRYVAGNYEKAARLFDEMVVNDELEEFFTLKAYPFLD